MTMVHWILLAIVAYLAVGVVAFFILQQTPYQEVAHWAVVLWPLWLFG